MKWRVFSVSLAMLSSNLFTVSAQATSQDECAIWLCLPGGFPGGCGAAHSAMVNRVKNRKSPLPDFGECSVNEQQGSGSHMTYSMTPAAFVPEHQECTQWSSWGDNVQCEAYQTIPAHYVEGTTCQMNNDAGGVNPPYCTQTVQQIKVLVDGKQAGSTFRW